MNFWQASEQGESESCRKGQAHVNVQPLARPNEQSASPPCCAARQPVLLHSPPKIIAFQLETRPSV